MKISRVLIGILIAIVFSAGCSTPSRVQKDYGTSFELAKFHQTLNPEGWRNLEPVTGLDGNSAQATVEKYRKGFEKEAPPTPYILNIGGIGQR
jgi:hypothetical protein